MLPPAQGLEVLHALVILAAETAAARGVLRAAHEARDELSHRRYELRKAISTAQKELRAAAKAEAGAKAAGGEPAEDGGKRATRRQGESPRELIEKDRLELVQVEAQLDAATIRLSQHLGTDRQHNDYWCIMPGGGGGAGNVMDFSGTLMVLCQEYSWVRLCDVVLSEA